MSKTLLRFECLKRWGCPELGERSSMSVHCFTMKFKLGEEKQLRNYQQPNNRAAPERLK